MYLDHNELNLMFGDDPEIFEEIFQDFLDSYTDMLGEIKESIDAQDAGKLQISAHTFKGVLGTFCATAPKDIAYELEEAGANGVFDGATQKYEKLCPMVEDFIKELKNFNFSKAA